MMFCSQCGSKIPDTATFCPVCGCKRKEGIKGNAGGASPDGPSQPSLISNDAHVRFSTRKRISLAAIIAIVVIAAASLLVPRIVEDFGRAAAPRDDTVIEPSLVVSDGTYLYGTHYSRSTISRSRINELYSEEVIYSAETIDNINPIPSLSLDEDYLYFYMTPKNSTTSESSGSYQELHRISTDGSEDIVLYSLDSYLPGDDGSSEDRAVEFYQVAAYKGTVYAIVKTTAKQDGQQAYQLLTMDSDGGNLKKLAHISGSGPYSFCLTPDKLYFRSGFTSQEGIAVFNSIHEMNLDGSDYTCLHSGGDMDFRDLIPYDGKLYSYCVTDEEFGHDGELGHGTINVFCFDSVEEQNAGDGKKADASSPRVVGSAERVTFDRYLGCWDGKLYFASDHSIDTVDLTDASKDTYAEFQPNQYYSISFWPTDEKIYYVNTDGRCEEIRPTSEE